MPVTADQVATLRAHLAGDFDTRERLYEKLDKAAAQSGYTALLGAAFCKAVERRFGKGKRTTVKDVTDFVGDVRSRSEDFNEKLDPRVSERMIRAALGDGSIADIDDGTVGYTEAILLTALIVDEHLDAAGLDDFMNDARQLADRWLSIDD
jgi:hypothetical protein